MTVSSINNIIFLKETKLDDAEARRAGQRRKADGESTTGTSEESKQAQEVAQENRAAGSHSPIEDFDQARDVLKNVLDMLDLNSEKGLASHSGQVVDPSVI